MTHEEARVLINKVMIALIPDIVILVAVILTLGFILGMMYQSRG